jgi:MFS family permease
VAHTDDPRTDGEQVSARTPATRVTAADGTPADGTPADRGRAGEAGGDGSGEPSEQGGSALGRLWHHPDFRRLLIGQAVSGLGDWMATVGLMALVLDITGSSTAVGGVLVLRLAPAIVAGPLTTRIVHRWDRKRMMLTMDAARIGVAVAIPLVSTLWWVYVWAFLMEVCGLIFLPARDAAVPDLAGEDDLPLANGLVLGTSYGTIPLGAGAFGLVAALFSNATTYVFWIDALTFAVSFATIRGMRSLRAHPERREGEPAAGPEEPARPDGSPSQGEVGNEEEEEEEEQVEGFLAAIRLPIVRVVGPTALVVSIGLGALFSLGIVFVRDVLGASNTEFGVLVALFGVGAAGGLAVVQVVGQPDLRGVLWIVGGQGVVVGGMSLAPDIGLAFVGAVLFGATTASALAAAMSLLQQRLDDDRRVMAFTAFHVLIRAGLAGAAIAAGAINDAFDGVDWPVLGHLPPARVVLFCSGIVVVLTSLASRGLAARLDPDRTDVSEAPAAAERPRR